MEAPTAELSEGELLKCDEKTSNRRKGIWRMIVT